MQEQPRWHDHSLGWGGSRPGGEKETELGTLGGGTHKRAMDRAGAGEAGRSPQRSCGFPAHGAGHLKSPFVVSWVLPR